MASLSYSISEASTLIDLMIASELKAVSSSSQLFSTGRHVSFVILSRYRFSIFNSARSKLAKMSIAFQNDGFYQNY